ncbi:MAG: Kae1-associated serine/threonine protein kinase [Thermoplasmatales archaeon]|nr:Kae1-associated serine/threonine protein kinase [Thermoplasmatales archaeon]
MRERGAEAVVSRETYMGRDAVRKRRVPKGYRHPDLDASLNSRRMRNEARLLRDARSAGVRTPIVYDVDPRDASIVMEAIPGRSLKKTIDSMGRDAESLCESLGESIGLLHSAGMTHGDPTTSNAIVNGASVWLIDFSMGIPAAGIEDMGVDVHLLERAMASAHPDAPWAFEAAMRGYGRTMADSAKVIDKVTEIRSRARYT